MCQSLQTFSLKESCRELRWAIQRRAEGVVHPPFIPPGSLGTLLLAAWRLTQIITLAFGLWLDSVNGNY